MTVKQTRCPFCSSAFYITSLQLNAYRGQARCGQCHQIFDATAHMVSTTPSPVIPPSVADEKHKHAEPRTAQSHTDPAALTDNDTKPMAKPAAVATSAPVAAPTPVPAPISTPGDEPDIQAVVAIQDSMAAVAEPVINDEPLLFCDEKGLDPEPADRTGSIENASVENDALLFSDEVGYPDEEPVVTSATKTSGAKSSAIVLDGTFDQNFLNDTFEEADILGQHELTGVEKLHKAADDSWLDDLLAEDEIADTPETLEQLEQSAKLSNRTAHINATTAAPLPEAMLHRASPDHDEDLLSFLNRTGAVTMPSSQTAKTGYSPNSRPASHRILKPTPIQSNPGHFIGWSLMCLLMVSLLVAQYLYFNFETLAMNPKTSAHMSRVCAIAGCQIPYMNASEIDIRNVRLIAHKNLGQTTFKGKITNTAKLSQPFPALRLTLQENGKTVASQIIQPRQYLPSELKTLTRLASKNLYPIEFTIDTRRSEIQGYELKAQYY